MNRSEVVSPLKESRREGSPAGMLADGSLAAVERRVRQIAWRTARADRLAVLIDASDYYGALFNMMEEAEHSVCIMGWDIDTTTRLRPIESDESFGETVNRLVEEKPDLRFRFLIWKLISAQASNRLIPPFRSEWSDHPRIDFRYDIESPVESSLHEKIVIIDGKIAFIGCTDISKERWDVEGHGLHVEAFRVNPDGSSYRPHHDLQAVLDGAAADTLQLHFDNVWKRNTGEQYKRQLLSSGTRDLTWPIQADNVVQDIDVHFSRTAPAFDGMDALTQVVDTLEVVIDAARELIYVEMQYMTAPKVADFLCRSLRKPDGPFVFIVLPEQANTYIEQKIMLPMQNARLNSLLENDTFGRLRVCYPELPPGIGQLMLHSKMILVDDQILYTGSANYNQRSMSVDTEMNFCIFAHSEVQRFQFQSLRCRLIGEHLGLDENRIRACATPTLLFELVDSCADNPRALRVFPISRDVSIEDAEVHEFSDPPALYGSYELASMSLSRKGVKRKIWTYATLVILGCIALALVWSQTPAESWLQAYLLEQGEQRTLASIVGISLVLVVASLLMMPITLVTAVCFILLGPWVGMVSALMVSLLSSASGFALGRWMDQRLLQRLIGDKLDALSDRLQHASHGITFVLMIRFLPIAPFTAVNLAIGASPIRFWHFLFGSFLGLLPGKVVIALFSDQALKFIEEPSLAGVMVFVVLAFMMGGMVYAIARWLERRAGK